jgi:hypothetical protein
MHDDPARVVQGKHVVVRVLSRRLGEGVDHTAALEFAVQRHARLRQRFVTHHSKLRRTGRDRSRAKTAPNARGERARAANLQRE